MKRFQESYITYVYFVGAYNTTKNAAVSGQQRNWVYPVPAHKSSDFDLIYDADHYTESRIYTGPRGE